MSFIKDDDLQIRLVDYPNNIIQIMAWDRTNKVEVRLGYVQGKQRMNKDGVWVSGQPDRYVAETVRKMVHAVLSTVQDLT